MRSGLGARRRRPRRRRRAQVNRKVLIERSLNDIVLLINFRCALIELAERFFAPAPRPPSPRGAQRPEFPHFACYFRYGKHNFSCY